MLLVPILTTLVLISPPFVHAGKKGKKFRPSRSPIASTSHTISSSGSITSTTPSTTTLSPSITSPSATLIPIGFSTIVHDVHGPIYSELVNALARLDNSALQSLAGIIQSWSFADSYPSTSLPAIPIGSSTSERAYSDPGSDDFPVPELGENLFASDDEEPGPSTPLPFPPSGPSGDLPSPYDEYAPRVRPVRPVPMPIENTSQPLHLNDTLPFTDDSFLTTTRIEINKPYRLKCWQGVLMRHMSPIYPQPGDCLDALTLLLAGDKQDAPILFSEKHGYRLPHRVAFNTCAIVVTISGGPTAAVTTTFREVGNIVRVILENCLDFEKDERGGMMTLGDLHVAVAGREQGKRGGPGKQAMAESYDYG